MKDQVSKFAFVAGGELGKPRAVDRKVIRSHCMRGRNRRNVVEQPDARWLGNNDALAPSARPLLLSFSISDMHDSRVDLKASSSKGKSKRRIITPQQLHPEKPGCNIIPSPVAIIPLVRFADEVDPESLGLLFTVFPVALRAFSLADLGLPGDLTSSQWRDWLFIDAAYVHAAITVSTVVRDFLLKRELSKATSFHLKKAISQLNKNLSDKTLSLSDASIAVIITISIASCISKDYVATSAHAAGLREMVRLQGGLDSFLGNPQLHIAMTRIDLCLSLSSGQSPIFSSSPSTFPRDSNTVRLDICNQWAGIPGLQSIDDLVDYRVAAVFRDLQHLAQSMNDATSGKRAMLCSDLHAGLTSTQYQLFELQGTLHDIISECIRVAMLAFLTTAFQILGSRIKYEHITNRLRELCRAVEVSTEQLRDVMFWVLMVGTLALFDSDEPWLREKWRLDILPLKRGQQWTDAKRLLKTFLWIDTCNEKAGKGVFKKMMESLGGEEDVHTLRCK